MSPAITPGIRRRPRDGQGIPPFSPRTAGIARSPDNQGTPPPPIDPDDTQVREKQRPDESSLQYRQDQKESQKVRKGVLMGNSTSSLSTPTRKDRKVRFDLPTRREWHEVGSYVPSRSSGLTPPIVSTIATQSSGQGCRNVRNIHEHQNRTKVKTKDSGNKLTWMPKSDKAAKDFMY